MSFDGEYLYTYKLRGKEFYLDGILEYEGKYLYNKNGKEKDMIKMVI